LGQKDNVVGGNDRKCESAAAPSFMPVFPGRVDQDYTRPTRGDGLLLPDLRLLEVS